MSRKNRPATKDMYWFAHGGAEIPTDKYATQRIVGEIEEETEANSLLWKNPSDRRGIYDEQKSCSRDISLTDGSNSSGPPSLERDERTHVIDKRTAAEERRKQLWEAEQERNDAVLRKHMERDAALEARRNAQRSNISFAFGSSVPRNVDTLQTNQNVESDIMTRSFTASGLSNRENYYNYLDQPSISSLNCTGLMLHDGISHRPDSSFSSHSEQKLNSQSCWLFGSGALIGEDLMTKSMTASISAPRGRRKNDLMPTVPYDRTATPRVATSSSSRRRSVSMTRLDQLAQPRRHYVEATKANSTTSSATSSMLKDVSSPNRPLSSASEHSGGRASSNVTRRVRSSPRKPRPVSIAGTIPDQKPIVSAKSHEVKSTPMKHTYTPNRKSTEITESKKGHGFSPKNSTPKSSERVKSTPRPATAPVKVNTPKQTATKATPKSKKMEQRPNGKSVASPSSSTSKMQFSKNSSANKRKPDVIPSPIVSEAKDASDLEEKSCTPPPPDSSMGIESDKNSKRIISEEEAKAALAEKRRLAREQAEREAELERQRQEEIKRMEEERLRQEEDAQRKLEEEHLRLLEEHRRQEDEKLRKAIEDQEQKEEEERAKRDEEQRLKEEQEKKAKEEADKLRLELEEKLRKEEEERAERKKRLEKIMSRTRGKSSATSPSGSISGSDQLDSGENQQDGFSSGANSLESNEASDARSEPGSSDDAMAKMEVSSAGNSIEANLTYEFGSNDVSLNSNDLMLPVSETASQDNSMVLVSEKKSNEESLGSTNASGAATPMNLPDELELNCEMLKENTESSQQENVSNISHEQKIVISENVASEFQACDIDKQQLNEMSENLAAGHSIETIKETFSAPNCNESVELSMNDSPNQVSVDTQPNTDAGMIAKEVDSISEGSFNKAQETTHLDTKFEYSDSEIPKINAVEQELIADTIQSSVAEKNLGGLESDSFHNISKEFDVDTSVENSVHPENLEQNYDNQNTNPANQEFLSSNIIPEQDLSISNLTSNPIEMYTNSFSDSHVTDSAAEEPLLGESQTINNSNESVVENVTQNQDFIEQPREIDEENICLARQSEKVQGEDFIAESSEIDVENQALTKFPSELEQEGDLFSKSFISFESNILQNVLQDEAANENKYDAVLQPEEEIPYHNKQENSPLLTNFESVENSGELFKLKESGLEIEAMGDSPLVHGLISDNSKFNMLQSQFVDCNIPESEVLKSEQSKSFELPFKQELDNVTLIKDEGGENYVGIISSIDNDHISNNYSTLHEQLTNNFECASTTDSENSSLDSNLSQVVAVEDSDKNIHMSLNNVQNSMFTADSVQLNSNNIGHSENPFRTQDDILNQISIPHSTLNHYSASDVYSNGHGVESSKAILDHQSELRDFVQLEGNNILSVDHSKNNIFENVDAIDYSKVSPDPFLVKGSSKQISGNPFLMQDEQKQVLMTSDFLN